MKKMIFMINTYRKYDIIIAKFPFASSLIYKARPALVISNSFYNSNRNTVIALAISSQIDNKLLFEPDIKNWKNVGLLKPSFLKSNIATIEDDSIIIKLGTLEESDKQNVDILISDVATAKQKIDRATIYLEEVIDENFGPKEFEVEDTLDIPSLNLQKEPMIRDETFFEDK